MNFEFALTPLVLVGLLSLAGLRSFQGTQEKPLLPVAVQKQQGRSRNQGRQV